MQVLITIGILMTGVEQTPRQTLIVQALRHSPCEERALMGEGRVSVSEAYPSSLARRGRCYLLHVRGPAQLKSNFTLTNSALPRDLDVMPVYHRNPPFETRNWTSRVRV